MFYSTVDVQYYVCQRVSIVKNICLLCMDHDCKRLAKSVPSLEIQTVYPTPLTSCLLFYLHLSNNIFKIQKRIIRIITNKCKHDSCRQLYKQLQILTLPAPYIFSLLMFVIKHRDFFPSNSDIHDRMTGILATIVTYIFLLLTSL